MTTVGVAAKQLTMTAFKDGQALEIETKQVPWPSCKPHLAALCMLRRADDNRQGSW